MRQKPLRDPSADASALLMRIGFFTLAVALPLASLVSRRAGVVLAPIGIGLLVAAQSIDDPRRLVRELGETVASRAGLFLVALTLWISLTAAWSPFRADGIDKALNIGFAVVLGLVGAAALPARMRASNLNLIAVGVGGASILAMVLAVGELRGPARPGLATDDSSLTRGLALVAVIAWPALAWLLSRGRSVAAIVLAVTVAVVALMRFGQGGATAVAVGAAVFGLVSARRESATRLVAAGVAAVMALAPLIPFAARPFSPLLPASWVERIDITIGVILAQPVKLITGHGLESVLRGKLANLLPANAPISLLFETWYELGLVGALSAAVCLYFAIRAAGRMPGPLAAGGVAAYATTFVLTAMGAATLQLWWLVTLAAVAILFTAIARGQVRTDRPLAPAWFNRRMTDRPGAAPVEVAEAEPAKPPPALP